VYFLLTGKVGRVLNIEGKQHVFMLIEEGNYFGEMDLLSNSALTADSSKNSKNDNKNKNDNKSKNDNKRKFTMVATEDCELLLWSKKNIYLADSEFGDVIQSILQTGKDRYENVIDAKNEFTYKLQRETSNTNFLPNVTGAHPTASDNIFQNKTRNYNEDGGNGTIYEESEGHDQTFEQLQLSGNMSPINRRKFKGRTHTEKNILEKAESVGTPSGK
jgi:hypothetical protein